MVDLSRTPTPRECNSLFKRGQRDALEARGHVDGAFRTPHADEVGRAYESCCEEARIDYEREVVGYEGCQMAAIDSLESAAKALEGLENKALPAADGADRDYQGEYRDKQMHAALDERTQKATMQASAARHDAGTARAKAMARVALLKRHAILWLQPYCEGLYCVDPSLVERLRPFEMGGMFAFDGISTVEAVTDQHPALFGNPAQAKTLEAPPEAPKALNELSSFADFQQRRDTKEKQYV